MCKKHFNTVRGTIYHVIIKHNVSELETVLGDDIEDHRLGESEVPAARPAFRGFNISRFVECHLCDSFYCSFEEYQTHFATDHRSNSEESSGVRERERLKDVLLYLYSIYLLITFRATSHCLWLTSGQETVLGVSPHRLRLPAEKQLPLLLHDLPRRRTEGGRSNVIFVESSCSPPTSFITQEDIRRSSRSGATFA